MSKRLNVWRDCTLCGGKGRFDDGIEQPWNCSACRGSGRLCDAVEPRFAVAQRRVLGYVIAERERAVRIWSHAHKEAAAAMLAGNAGQADYWLSRVASEAAKLAAMGVRA